MKSIWLVEGDPDYLEFLKSVQDRHPRVTKPLPTKGLRAGDSIVGRTLLLAEDRGGTLYIGVRLNTEDEFWKPWDGSFAELIEDVARDGAVQVGGQWISTSELLEKHVPDEIGRLEFCSSPVGSSVMAVMKNDTRLIVDEG